ncbi:uncharacterized protein N7515_002611 [Penicillium bovifimosum]|uniref:Uncharacterized protein n=1 Tax=Penicillium bovifimosum TaxID=126998 RepID=A0A9W9HC95_9EURO|nr:uncharacterized protein N7515_002611 [Penicillium bovifimosum]KAJ5143824.1 hypothetical protein N7515_002611 [Penicillium bovifimosum]
MWNIQLVPSFGSTLETLETQRFEMCVISERMPVSTRSTAQKLWDGTMFHDPTQITAAVH